MKEKIKKLIILAKAKMPTIPKKILTIMSAMLAFGIALVSLPEGSLPKMFADKEVAQWCIVLGVIGSVFSLFTAKDDDIKPGYQKKLEDILEKLKAKKLGLDDENK